jgi:hypothetical protein
MTKIVFVKPAKGTKSTCVNMDQVLYFEHTPKNTKGEKAFTTLYFGEGLKLDVENTTEEIKELLD